MRCISMHLNASHAVIIQCWKRLEVTANLNFLRSFPSHFRFIVLQHSEDKWALCLLLFLPVICALYSFSSICSVSAGPSSMQHTSFLHNPRHPLRKRDNLHLLSVKIKSLKFPQLQVMVVHLTSLPIRSSGASGLTCQCLHSGLSYSAAVGQLV